MVVLDSAGLLHVEARIDDLIISDGINISPVAARGALSGLPGVRELVLVGVPDAEWGQRVVAVVVPDEGAVALTLETLRAYGRASLPTSPAAPRRPGDPTPAIRQDRPRSVARSGG